MRPFKALCALTLLCLAFTQAYGVQEPYQPVYSRLERFTATTAPTGASAKRPPPIQRPTWYQTNAFRTNVCTKKNPRDCGLDPQGAYLASEHLKNQALAHQGISGRDAGQYLLYQIMQLQGALNPSSPYSTIHTFDPFLLYTAYSYLSPHSGSTLPLFSLRHWHYLPAWHKVRYGAISENRWIHHFQGPTQSVIITLRQGTKAYGIEAHCNPILQRHRLNLGAEVAFWQEAQPGGLLLLNSHWPLPYHLTGEASIGYKTQGTLPGFPQEQSLLLRLGLGIH